MTARAQRPAQRSRGPFSRITDVRRLPDNGLASAVEATPEECAALALAMNLPAVASMVGRFELRRRGGGRVEVTGEVSADVTQLCVVTLDPFTSRVTQPVDLVFAQQATSEAEEHGRAADRGRRQLPDRQMPERVVRASVPGSDDQVDPPDPIIDDAIDLGAVTAEFVALALDPYPRKPGVSFDDVVEGPEVAEPSAFAALERLKARP